MEKETAESWSLYVRMKKRQAQREAEEDDPVMVAERKMEEAAERAMCHIREQEANDDPNEADIDYPD